MSLTPYTSADSDDIITVEDLMRAISSPLSTRERPLRTERINVAHVASALNRYAGEKVTFFTRLQAREDLLGFDLEIKVPAGFQVREASCLSGQSIDLPNIFPVGQETYVVWKLATLVETEDEYEFAVDAIVRPVEEDYVGLSRAAVTARSREHNEQLEDEETTAVTVLAHARYLRYLPALYTHDRLMNRFLMLFESFWEPINQQVSNIDKYFDPSVTPREFLPWLSTWIALNTAEDEAPAGDSNDPGTTAHRGQVQMPPAQIAPSAQSRSVGPAEAASEPPARTPDALSIDLTSGDSREVRALPILPQAQPATDLSSSHSGEDGISAAITPYQARQTYLPTPEGGVAPVRGVKVGAAEEDEHLLRQRLAREPLILPSPAQNTRQLLRFAQQLHKRRGTRTGLQQYLEIYTATEVHVIEHRAENFQLKERGSLGSRVALGRDNHPHSFTVVLRFPVRKEKLAQLSDALIEERKDAIRRRVIPIIEDQKPAHTTYALRIEVSPV